MTKKYLFGAFHVGWEAGIGYNAFYYPNGNYYYDTWPTDASHDPTYFPQCDKGLSCGVQQIGYNAVRTSGRKTSGTIDRYDIGNVTQQYLSYLSKLVNSLGIPKDLIFTHEGGNAMPWDLHLRFAAAINEWSNPGWSFYFLDPASVPSLQQDMELANRTKWAAIEWLWPGSTAAEWLDHLRRTISWKTCKFVDIYNWEGIKDDQGAIQAIKHTPNKSAYNSNQQHLSKCYRNYSIFP